LIKRAVNKKTYLLIFIILSNFLFAQIPEKILEAFNNLEADSIYVYAFHKKTTDPEGSILESYNPNARQKKWQLLSVNNQKADPERLKKYQEEMNESDHARRESRRFDFNEKTMQDFQIINETDQVIFYTFRLKPEENDKIDELKGEITLHKNPGWIERIKVYNQAPFSPALPVKIDTFKMDMKYQRLKDTKAIKLKTIQTRIKARAFVFKKIDTKVTQEYFNYELVE